MPIEIVVEPDYPLASAIQADLGGELAGLQRQGITITSKTSPPPPDALGAAEVYSFIILHQEELVRLAVLVRAVLDVVFAVLRRRQISPYETAKTIRPRLVKKSTKARSKPVTPKGPTIIVIQIGTANLSIPCTPQKEAAFIAELAADQAHPPRGAAKS